jgi:Enoyl-CoA hydratase/isomerase
MPGETQRCGPPPSSIASTMRLSPPAARRPADAGASAHKPRAQQLRNGADGGDPPTVPVGSVLFGRRRLQEPNPRGIRANTQQVRGPGFGTTARPICGCFTYPRPTVAAVNGHAFAGDLITAVVCDHRVAVADGARFALNEVPIGIPIRPHARLRLRRADRGPGIPARGDLLARTDTCAWHGARLVPADALLDRAIAIAESTPEDCLAQYAFTKGACQASVLRDIAQLADEHDFRPPSRTRVRLGR